MLGNMSGKKNSPSPIEGDVANIAHNIINDAIHNKIDSIVTLINDNLSHLKGKIELLERLASNKNPDADTIHNKVNSILSDFESFDSNMSRYADAIGAPINTGGTSTISAILGDSRGISVVDRLDKITEYVDDEVKSIKMETDQIGSIVNTGGNPYLGSILGDFAGNSLVSRLEDIIVLLSALATGISNVRLEVNKLPDYSDDIRLLAKESSVDKLNDELYLTKGLIRGLPDVGLVSGLAKEETLVTFQKIIEPHITNIYKGIAGTEHAIKNVTNDINQSTATALDDLVKFISGRIQDIEKLVKNIIIPQNQSLSGKFKCLSSSDEQTVVELNADVPIQINSIWLDLSNITQDGVIKIYYKIDGVNYRLIESLDHKIGEDHPGFLIDVHFNIMSDFKVTYTSVLPEKDIKEIFYNLLYIR